jgi:hypothetical protein
MAEAKDNYAAGEKVNATDLNQISQNVNDAGGFRDDIQAAETITALRPVFLDDTANQWKYCDANDTTRLNFDGFALEAGSANAAMAVQLSGTVRGLSSLDVGKKYYVQDDGTIGTTPGTYVIKVGVAISATELLIDKTTQREIMVVASDNLQASADTERSTNNTSYVLGKEIKIRFAGTVRVKFDLKANWNGNASGYGKAIIYVNGTAVGTERTNTTETYINYSEDITVAKNDLIQLYYLSSYSNRYGVIQNFRIYFDRYFAKDYVVNAD